MLKKTHLGEVVIELSEIDSTNNYAMRLINAGMAEHGMVIRADFQTAGKGQLGNKWQAEESKNLLFSFILDTSDIHPDKQFFLNAAACLSVADLLMSNYELREVSIKWPNDIYTGNKKIAGILIENVIRGNTWSHAIIGIGLNVNQTQFQDLNHASSIQLETNKSHKVPMVMKHLLKKLQKNCTDFYTSENLLLEQYNKNLRGMNELIHFKKNHQLYKGRLLGVTSQGLIIIEHDGKQKNYQHKEIELQFN